MLVSGVGVYTPKFSAPDTATPSHSMDVGGTGYPARTPIVIGWSNGSGEAVEVVTDDHGNFLTTFPVDISQRPGTLVRTPSHDASAASSITAVAEPKPRIREFLTECVKSGSWK